MRLFFIAPLFVILICILVNTTVNGQSKKGSGMYSQAAISISGTILDENNKPLPAASVAILETQQKTLTSHRGSFQLDVNTKVGSVLTIYITNVGKQDFSSEINIVGTDINLGNIKLFTRSLSLDSITVVASLDSRASSNSSLIINRDIIEQTPALSLMDLLNQIPGRKITPPSLQNVQTINLRGVFEGTTSGRNAYALNNSAGVAIVMDGNTISNNMNMQSFNPLIQGMASSATNVSTGNGYGLIGAGTTSYSGDYAFGGIDLRQIPSDNIEKIEVVSGVASARYGDLTDGAVIIERRAGITPGYFRVQLRDNATTYSFSQGIKLSEKAGSLSYGINYANSYADARDRLKAYRRINGNAMWSNRWGKKDNISNTFSLDYGQNLDGIKQDPDDITNTRVRFDSWSFSSSNRTNFKINRNFLKNVGVNLRYSEGHQYSYREQQVNDVVITYTDAETTGIHEGIYAPGIFTAYLIIDGRPVNASARLDFDAEATTGNIVHYFSFGTNYNYGKNKGEGQLADPTRPRVLVRTTASNTSTKRSERYYDFSRVVAQEDFGFYLEDRFNSKIFGKTLRTTMGVRADVQNGFLTAAPRINTTYALTPDWQVGLAYGLAYKSPGLAQRYPGPLFTEIPLLNAFNGNAAESRYIVYVQRYDQTNKNLRSAKTQTIEFTTQYRKKGFSVNLNVYAKWLNNGINTIGQYHTLNLPGYEATFVAGSKPLVRDTGSRKFLISTNQFANSLNTSSRGIEVLMSTPQINKIHTSFNLSGGYTMSSNLSDAYTYRTIAEDGANIANPNRAYLGVYNNFTSTSEFANARVSTATHIPKLSLVLQFIAECSFIQKTTYDARSGIPIAYYNNNYEYVEINNFDPANPNYSHLYRPENELNAENINKPIWNYHMSLAKDIKKRLKIAFNVYNVFNYQPYYTNSANTRIFLNAAPSFGAELSVKL